MLSLAWPWILVLLPLPFFAQTWQRSSDTDGNRDAIKVTPRLKKALDDVSAAPADKRWGNLLLLWLIWILLLLAIAQPTVPDDAKAQPASGRTIAMVIDLSASMERKDFSIDGVPVDRLSVVKRIAGEFIQNRVGDRVALILFGAEAFLSTPPSYDLASVTHELTNSGIGMAGRTTAIGDALGLAIQSLRGDPAPDKAIVLLSDGTNNAGSAEPESAARLASQLSIRIHTIGLGSETPNRKNVGSGTTSTSTGTDTFLYTATAAADLDETTLQAIATESGGRFFRARTTTELEQIYTEINQLEGGEAVAPPVIVHRDIRNLFVLAVLVLSVLQALLVYRKRQLA